ncbi:hypothetical protein PFLUV_G00091300 [Perca fluviatilis]|uniref:Uncharacterized protein n=1 Tax=Perca fluviatilis TaxID=8168 RepID=A0A6A5F912_PERFL|nr:hypothetical protein PFLUV_G00091300 [Perca fluviatilis]
MFSFKMLLFALTLTLLVVTVQSGSISGGSTNFNYPDNLSGSSLRNLFNSPVQRAEVVKRPLGVWPLSLFTLGPISHSGVRLTLDDAESSQYLIHKGRNHGISSQTVVTSADNMSPKWRATGQSRDFNGEKRVSDFVAAGGETYSLPRANCHDATTAMMNQDK